jgi:anti-sigma regulatory factor (Ser/Thr protein kinase)
MPTAQLRLPPEPRSVQTARRMARDTLASWGLDTMEFAASQGLTELATNAVLHARTDFEVTLDWSDGVLRVCVRDYSRKPPRQRNYAAEATTGRGLSVVDRLCQSWGVEPTPDGKQVWFEVTEAGAPVGLDNDVRSLVSVETGGWESASTPADIGVRLARTSPTGSRAA